MNYYNEFDKKAAQWLRELIKEGLIPNGEVDERDIREVGPQDLKGFIQCHFFAGIGGWADALRLADWPQDKEVWTGSCPCQPFSVAGKGDGLDDERHLWPAFRWLIAQCRPPTIFGEQVASKDGREWIAGVHADVEAMGYVCGVADLCAPCLGSPHIRQRLWWVADGTRGPAHEQCQGSQGRIRWRENKAGQTQHRHARCNSAVDWSRSVWWPCRDGKLRRVPARRVEDASISRIRNNNGSTCGQGGETVDPGPESLRQEDRSPCSDGIDSAGGDSRLGDLESGGCGVVRDEAQPGSGRHTDGPEFDGGVPDTTGLGRAQAGRRTDIDSGCCPEEGCVPMDEDAEHGGLESESEILTVVNGIFGGVGDCGTTCDEDLFPLTPDKEGRTGLLKGAGNAIIPQVAELFIRSYRDG